MTSSLLNHPSSAGKSDRNGSERPKSVLFCQNCGHESPIAGDWHIARVDRRTRREKVVYTCPECARTVTTRPDSSRNGNRRANQGPVSNAQ